MADLVLVDTAVDTVAVVTLNRPAKYNALSGALLAELSDTVAALAGDPSLRALVLTGSDPAFCAGLDLTELGDPGGAGGFGHEALDVLRAFPVPVIGAVNGVAVTGGLELALACDFRIASEHARFADTHARVGVVPGWGLTARLPQAVGQAWARQLSFTGDYIDAPTALRIGLVNEVVDHLSLLDRAVGLAASIAETVADTTARIRHSFDLGRDGSGADSLACEHAAASEHAVTGDPADFAARRQSVLDRGRTARGGTPPPPS